MMPEPVSAERPLDSLIEGLAPAAERRLGSGPPVQGQHPIHPRVLEVRTGEGQELVFVGWSDPGGARALHEGLRRMIEATLLNALTQPAVRGEAVLSRRWTGLRFLSFADVTGIERAVQAFGMSAVPFDDEAGQDVMTVIRAEAEAMGRPVPGTPIHAFRSRVDMQDGTWGDKLLTLQRWMAERMGDDVWGATPGGPSKLLSLYLREEVGESIEPTPGGLDRMEFLLVSRSVGVVRWMPPLLFQALCDFIGVVLSASMGVQTSWALCEPEEDGLIPPPLFRVVRAGRMAHLPIGPHVLRWCMMPLLEGEEVPLLSEWLRDEFGGPNRA
ncbi:MAG: hypothetical protein EA398_16085 [Deltaproteobacteria bacterium]|nr:MAG: hypothetical protein EA398_16085 [Deltaproteobacteria bacterium]